MISTEKEKTSQRKSVKTLPSNQIGLPQLHSTQSVTYIKSSGLFQFNSALNTAVGGKKREDYTEKKIIFGNRFEINSSRLLGKGSFGEIYIAQDIEKNYQYCALKIENRTKNYFLKIERNVMELTKNSIGFPQLITFNSQGESNYLAMNLLGPNLYDLFDVCDGHFTMQTTLLIGIQMLIRIQELHSKNYLHRDIKPENFLIGIGYHSNIIYIIDFGLSKKYKDSKMNHLPYREHRPLTGTTRYASINNHLGIEQSRRDDLESIGYVLIYFIKKRLPWQGTLGSTKQSKYNKILEKKLMIPVELLCKDLPMEFTIYMKYVKSLRFDERPDYDFLKGLFTELLSSLYSEKFYYDWTLRYPDDAKNVIFQTINEDNENIIQKVNKDSKIEKKNNNDGSFSSSSMYDSEEEEESSSDVKKNLIRNSTDEEDEKESLTNNLINVLNFEDKKENNNDNDKKNDKDTNNDLNKDKSFSDDDF